MQCALGPRSLKESGARKIAPALHNIEHLALSAGPCPWPTDGSVHSKRVVPSGVSVDYGSRDLPSADQRRHSVTDDMCYATVTGYAP